MISKSDRADVYFRHKTMEVLQTANSCTNKARRRRNLDQDTAEAIDSAKYLFRDFLQQVIDGRYPLELPPAYSLSRIREAYTKSDFDWKDPKQYKKFQRWFCGTS